jgi:hypothetical protein
VSGHEMELMSSQTTPLVAIFAVNSASSIDSAQNGLLASPLRMSRKCYRALVCKEHAGSDGNALGGRSRQRAGAAPGRAAALYTKLTSEARRVFKADSTSDDHLRRIEVWIFLGCSEPRQP